MSRILIVEDEIDLADGLQCNLEAEGHDVQVAGRAAEALALASVREPELVVLDLGLPDRDGFHVLETLRGRGSTSPVLILSARDLEADKVRGFRLGADDYVTKPFGVMELMARVSALLRRARAAAPPPPPTPAATGTGPDDEALRARYGLTERQVAVARLLGEGCTNAEVAERLGISTYTARNHTEQVLGKLGAPTRARVAAMLRGNG
ncbi:MAG TPA: response regulator [Longimicrobiaceae bacterium]